MNKRDFPIFKKKINGKPLVYLDSASTTQKPTAVIESEKDFYEQHNANVHRSVNSLSQEATELYEGAREKVANFVGAQREEIIFTRNATESINLVARTFGSQKVKRGGTILLTEMEHHSNIVPWQLLAKEKGAKVEFVPITVSGQLDLEEMEVQLARRPALFAFTHVSNVLGTVNPVEKIVKIARKYRVPVVLDACQSVGHFPINVKKLGVDFAAFSGHKLFAPTGIGFLYGKKKLLDEMPPFLTGGDMIKTVSKTTSTWNDVPWKFEAGTPNIAGAVALGAAVDYLNHVGMNKIHSYNSKLVNYCVAELQKLGFVKVYPPLKNKYGAVAFNVNDVHPHDVSTVLDGEGVEIRAGHHCCQPLMKVLGVESTCRASFQFYNDERDVDAFVNGLKKCKKVFSV
ncbi:MAG: cysteine desulfurase [Candidatus Micrarchaeota archaeon]